MVLKNKGTKLNTQRFTLLHVEALILKGYHWWHRGKWEFKAILYLFPLSESCYLCKQLINNLLIKLFLGT